MSTPPVWPTRECTRCGGSGRYSWCQMYGDTCFKCSGSGLQFTNARVETVVAEYREALRRQRETPAYRLGTGDRVYVNRNADGTPRLASRKDGRGEWVDVYDATPDIVGMYVSSWTGVRYTGETRRTARADRVMASDLGTPRGASLRIVTVTLVTGEAVRVSGAQTFRTFATGVDPVPYLRRCADALGKTSRAKARADYEATLAAAGWTL